MTHPATLQPIYIWPARNQQLPPLTHQKLRLTSYQRRKPEIGLLKAAYLSVFSLLGVEFAKANSLAKVRKQIAQPDDDSYRDFCFTGEDVGRAVCIVYTTGKTCWGVSIDGHWVLLPSADADECNLTLDDLREYSAIKKFTHAFGANRRFLFQMIYRVPIRTLTDDVRQGLGQVGSLGWHMRVETNSLKNDFISVGRDQDSLWFLEYHEHKS